MKKACKFALLVGAGIAVGSVVVCVVEEIRKRCKELDDEMFEDDLPDDEDYDFDFDFEGDDFFKVREDNASESDADNNDEDNASEECGAEAPECEGDATSSEGK